MPASPRRQVARMLVALAAGVAILTGTAATSFAQATWNSGVRHNDDTNPFATWRGTSNKVVAGWIDWKNGWSGMYKYASGSSPRQLRAKSSNVSFGHGLFPKDGNLAACAAGEYDDEQAEVARRLRLNGVGDAEIRLGWEASGDWYPWSAAGKPAAQWKACFVRIARAMKRPDAAPNLRIGWFVAKKGRIDVRTIYPDGPDAALITNIGVSHYDDAQARFGSETYLGGPWGLRAFLQFAKDKGKRFVIGEWGVGRVGDNPTYIENMHAFLKEAAPHLAHEAYFNANEHKLYPGSLNPRAAARYRELF